jgi:hypothetical protein
LWYPGVICSVELTENSSEVLYHVIFDENEESFYVTENSIKRLPGNFMPIHHDKSKFNQNYQ